MPLYEYRCRDCGHTVEVIQKLSDPPLSVCKACGGALERLLSAPAIQFKGTGWYITDYARGAHNKNGSGPKSSSAPATETSASSTASTPAKPKAD